MQGGTTEGRRPRLLLSTGLPQEPSQPQQGLHGASAGCNRGFHQGTEPSLADGLKQGAIVGVYMQANGLHADVHAPLSPFLSLPILSLTVLYLSTV